MFFDYFMHFLRFVSCLLSIFVYFHMLFLFYLRWSCVQTHPNLTHTFKHTYNHMCSYIFGDIANGFVNSNSEIDVNNVNNNQATEPQRKSVCVCLQVHMPNVYLISINISIHMHIQLYMYCVYVVCWLCSIYTYISIYIYKKKLYSLEIGVCTWFMFQRVGGSDLQNTHTQTSQTHKLLTLHTYIPTHTHT